MTLDPKIFTKELEESEAFFQALANGFRKRSALAKTKFLAADLEMFSDGSIVALTAFMLNAYKDLVFFPDREIINRFKEIGVKEHLLTCFVSMEEIVQQINTITEDGKVWMPKGRILFLIKCHLDIRITNEVAHWVEFSAPLNGKQAVNKTKLNLYKMLRRRRYSGGTPKTFKSPFDEELHRYIDIFEGYVSNKKDAEALLLDLFGGGSDTNLFRCIRNLSIFDNKNEYKRRFYYLFQLLSSHHILLSKELHDRLPRYYGRSFAIYQARRFDQLTR